MSFGELSSAGGTKANAPRDLDKGPHVRFPKEDKDELLLGGDGRTQGSAEPGQALVQVQLDKE